MRVCFIVNQLAAWGKIGGFGTNTRRLARGLVARGIEVHAAIPARNGPTHRDTLDGIAVHPQTDAEVFFGTRLYREIDADIYHAEEPTICAFWAQRAMADRVHLITSMDPRERGDWLVELKNATWSRRLKYPMQYLYEDSWFVHQAVRQADGVYVEAELLKEKTRRLYRLGRDPGLLPKPIEIPAGPFEKSARPLCVFLARFDPRKRPEMFFQLVQRMPDVDFIAIGKAHDASYQSYLEQYFRLPNLQVTGFVDPFRDDSLRQILSRAWLLIHPAAREGLPTSFQEASTHEMAVVAFVDPGGYVSRHGRVVAEGDGLAGLEAAVRQLIDSGAWRELGQAGRAYNIAHHALDHSVDEHLRIYASHLNQKDGRSVAREFSTVASRRP